MTRLKASQEQLVRKQKALPLPGRWLTGTVSSVTNRHTRREISVTTVMGTVVADVSGIAEQIAVNDLVLLYPKDEMTGRFVMARWLKQDDTNSAGNIYVPPLRTNSITGQHGFVIEVFDEINSPGEGHQSKLEWSQAGTTWRIHAANDGAAAGLDLQKGNLTLAAGYTVDGVDVSGLANALVEEDFSAKGDLLSASADDTLEVLNVGGTDGSVLTENSAAASGLAWSSVLKVTATAVTINDAGADVDTIIEGDTDTNLIVADAGLDVVSIGGAAVSGQKATVYAGAAAVTPLVVKGAAAQSATLQEWQDSSANIKAAISSTGAIHYGSDFIFQGNPIAYANPIVIDGVTPECFMYIDATWGALRFGTQAGGPAVLAFEVPSGGGYQDCIGLSVTTLAPSAGIDNSVALGITGQRWASLWIGTGTGRFDGAVDIRGALTVNEDGADVDTRIEGDNNANCFTLDAGNDNITINAAAVSAHYDLGLCGDGVLMLKETSTPTADANYGKVYCKNDDKLYFQDGAGNEHEIAFA